MLRERSDPTHFEIKDDELIDVVITEQRVKIVVRGEYRHLNLSMSPESFEYLRNKIKRQASKFSAIQLKRRADDIYNRTIQNQEKP